jgi:hypothetical protein
MICVVTTQTTDKSAVETAIDNAKEQCESGTTGECAAAWDEVNHDSHVLVASVKHLTYASWAFLL